MRSKTVTTRKTHRCWVCDEKIEKGSQAQFLKTREPRHNKKDEQIGIEYINIWAHVDCVLGRKNKNG